MSRIVLVTGAGGQVGRALLAATWPAGLAPLGLIRADLDIGQGDAVEQALDASGAVALVNAAAYTAVDKAESEPAAAWHGNAEAVALLAAATARRGIPLLQLSTDFGFDGAKGAPYLEGDAVNPLSVYGASKAAGEVAARANPLHLILRTAWVFDAAGRNFLNTMLRLMAERPELTVVADQRGQPTAAADIAAALVRLLALRRGGADRQAAAGAAAGHGRLAGGGAAAGRLAAGLRQARARLRYQAAPLARDAAVRAAGAAGLAAASAGALAAAVCARRGMRSGRACASARA